MHACLPVEARVLAGMICEPDILDLCDDVESADFVDMRHVVVFNAIRDVQNQGVPVDVDLVLEAIQTRAIEQCAFGILEQVNAEFLCELITKAPPGGLRTIRRDTARLRSDRDFRESLYMANKRPAND